MATPPDLFRAAYIKASETSGGTPSPYVLEQCDPEASSGDRLECGGNARGLHPRPTSADACNIATALGEGHPFVHVDLSSCQLGSESASALASVLRADTIIEVLNLSNNDFSTKDAGLLCKAIAVNPTLHELCLGGNGIGSEGGMAVADLLQKNSVLTVLRLGNCGLDTRAIVAISTTLRTNTSLQQLDISRPLLTSPQMQEAVDHLSRALAVNGSLTHLDLSKCGVRDKGLSMVASALSKAGSRSCLATLKLRCNEIQLADDEAVGALNDLLSSFTCPLRSLDLNANRLQASIYLS